MPQGHCGTGVVAEAGLARRRDDVAAYARAYRAVNSEKSNEYARNYYHNVTKKDPTKLKAKNKCGAWVRRKKKYGITKKEYTDLLTKQQGRCYICHDDFGEDLRVDHDHSTGAIRALLCANCNSGIGFFNEEPDRLKAAAEYVSKRW